jgi:hypothetical protein
MVEPDACSNDPGARHYHLEEISVATFVDQSTIQAATSRPQLFIIDFSTLQPVQSLREDQDIRTSKRDDNTVVNGSPLLPEDL